MSSVIQNSGTAPAFTDASACLSYPVSEATGRRAYVSTGAGFSSPCVRCRGPSPPGPVHLLRVLSYIFPDLLESAQAVSRMQQGFFQMRILPAESSAIFPVRFLVHSQLKLLGFYEAFSEALLAPLPQHWARCLSRGARAISP